MQLNYNHPESVNAFFRVANLKNGGATLANLTKLMQEFLKFPYENLTKIIHFNTAKDESARYRLPEILWNEHLEWGSGGTCFSLTYFFETILKSAGFNCYPVMVDRSYGKNTHCAIICLIDGGKYLVDPGFCLSRPITITKTESIHKLPHNTYILSPLGNNQYSLSTSQAGTVKSRYVLKDFPVTPAEFLKHWKDSFSWPMMRHLCITRLSEDGYLYLRDKFLRHTTAHDKKQENITINYDNRIADLFNLSQDVVKLASNIILERK